LTRQLTIFNVLLAIALHVCLRKFISAIIYKAYTNLNLTSGRFLMSGTTTPKLNLYKPGEGDTGWADLVNDNWDTIDNLGDASGPASSIDNGIALFDGTTGKLLKDSNAGTVDATMGRFSADANAPNLLFHKSRNATVGSHTIVSDGDNLGTVKFQGSDGDSWESGAEILAEVDGTPGASDMPGRLVFKTTPDGSATPESRMLIDSSGNMAIGTAFGSPSTDYNKLTINNSGGHAGLSIMSKNDSAGGVIFGDSDAGFRGGITYDHNTNMLSFVSNGSGRLYIDSSGYVGMGISDPGSYTGTTARNLVVGSTTGETGVSIVSGSNNTGRLYFVDGKTGTAAYKGGVTYSHTTDLLSFFTNGSQKAYIDSSGNVGIGTSTFGTSAANVLCIKNNTAPSSSPADSVQLYAEDVSGSSELKVRDEADNVTVLSPHAFPLVKKSETMAWSYYSENHKAKKCVNIDMMKLARLVEKITGEKLVHIAAIPKSAKKKKASPKKQKAVVEKTVKSKKKVSKTTRRTPKKK
jgi:hypothetical protein